MFEGLKQFAINRGWIKGPAVLPKKEVVPVDPITELANRSNWTIQSIHASVQSLAGQNEIIKAEHQVREDAKLKLQQEQNTLGGIRAINEGVIAKAQAIFQN